MDNGRIWPSVLETALGFVLLIVGGGGWLFTFALAGSDSALGDPGVWLQLTVLLVPVVAGVILFVHGGIRVVRRGM